METKKIRALLAAVEHGSLSAAAEAQGYTQSGLTHMMRSIEDELGLEVLIRGRYGVHLSEHGKALMPKFRALLDADDALTAAAEELQDRRFGTLHIGAYSSVARHWLPSVLSEFRSMSPDTELELYVGGMPDIFERLRNGQLDCAFISNQASLARGLKYIPLRDDPLLAILPEGGGDDTAFPVERFSGCDFIMPSAGFELDIIPVFGKSVESVARRVRRINFDDAALVSMVEHGLGLTILSELVMQDMPFRVRALPLDPPAFRYLGIAVSEKNYGSRTIRSFIKCAQDTVNALY